MFASVLSPKAEVELSEMMLFLENERAACGDKFLEAYRSTELLIRHFPESASIVKNGYRQILIRGFSVMLVYKFKRNRVWIHHVIHAARKPSRRYKK